MGERSAPWLRRWQHARGEVSLFCMKVAYVVPRYGLQIRGGAETGARMLAEHLVADRGDKVEVFTSAALDALTWRDNWQSGPSASMG